MNPRQDRKRDVAERMAHLEETMTLCHWPVDRGIAEFLEMEEIAFCDQISEQQYWDEEWKDYIEDQHAAIIEECRAADYTDWGSYDDY